MWQGLRFVERAYVREHQEVMIKPTFKKAAQCTLINELTVLLEVLEVLLVFQPAQRRVAAVVLCHPTAFLRVQGLALYHAGLQGLASYRHQVLAHCSSALAGLNLSWPAQLWLYCMPLRVSL